MPAARRPPSPAAPPLSRITTALPVSRPADRQPRGARGAARHPPCAWHCAWGKTPATADLIARLLAACPPTLIGLRDRALIAFGFAGAFRRSELLALEVAGLHPTSFAGHSLRPGFLPRPPSPVAEASRHKSLDTLRRYVRRANLSKAHAGAGFSVM